MKYPADEIQQATSIAEDGFDTWQCINCGAYAETIDKIQHADNCKPGEARKWEKFYEDANAEEEVGP